MHVEQDTTSKVTGSILPLCEGKDICLKSKIQQQSGAAALQRPDPVSVKAVNPSSRLLLAL